MIELDGSHPPRIRLKVGDVVMVHRWIEKPKHGNPFWWKWLGTVVLVRAGARLIKVVRFGADEGKDEVDLAMRHMDPEVQRIWFIPETEWPDGVHAFRTRLILEGRLDDVVG